MDTPATPERWDPWARPEPTASLATLEIADMTERSLSAARATVDLPDLRDAKDPPETVVAMRPPALRDPLESLESRDTREPLAPMERRDLRDLRASSDPMRSTARAPLARVASPRPLGAFLARAADTALLPMEAPLRPMPPTLATQPPAPTPASLPTDASKRAVAIPSIPHFVILECHRLFVFEINNDKVFHDETCA